MSATTNPISPAPWSTRPCNQGFYTISAADGHLVCKVPCDRMDRLAQAVADTRAIAALPVLLAALELARSAMTCRKDANAWAKQRPGCDCWACNTMNTVDTALAAAKGGAL